MPRRSADKCSRCSTWRFPSAAHSASSSATRSLEAQSMIGRHWFRISAESWRWAFPSLVAPGLLLGLWSFFRRDLPRGATTMPLSRAASRPVARLSRSTANEVLSLHHRHDGDDVRDGGTSFVGRRPLRHDNRHIGDNGTQIFGAIRRRRWTERDAIGRMRKMRFAAGFQDRIFWCQARRCSWDPLFLAVLWLQQPAWHLQLHLPGAFPHLLQHWTTNATPSTSRIRRFGRGIRVNILVIHALGDVI